MFTGIVETVGTVKEIIQKGSNLSFWIESLLSTEFKIDQSICHDGVCLTIEEIQGSTHRVTAILETLQKTNLETWKPGTNVNIERSLTLSQRIDGHIVQGHVDTTAQCINKIEKNGSWEFTFQFPASFAELIIEKGSICVNGISLTAFNAGKNDFSVAIIPYTLEHTNIRFVEKGSIVNIEFDILGKYLLRRNTLG